MLPGVAPAVEDSTPSHLFHQLIAGVCHTDYSQGLEVVVGNQIDFPVAAAGLGNGFLWFEG